MKIKKSLSIILIIFIFSCNKEDVKQTLSCKNILDKWEVKSVSIHDGLQKQNDIFFPTESIGFSVGNAGSIMKTNDEGENWEIIEFHYLPETGINSNSLTKARLLTAFFIDELIGYVGGEGETSALNSSTNTDAVFLTTVDGGTNWNKIYIEGVRKINDLIFSDSNNGLGLFYMADSNEKKLFRTENAGVNWSEVDLPIDKIASNKFVNSENKIIIRGVDETDKSIILTSLDNGENWETNSTQQEICNRIYFINDEVGFASCGLLFFPETVYKTIDGGSSWQEVESPFNVSSLIHFNSEEEGFIINPNIEYVEGGGELNPVLQHYEVFQTIDGGENWKKSEIDKSCNLMGVSYSPSKKVFFNIGNTANKFKIK
jgi:photosystem II stability/assembly factor-like uncharacterized protein